MGAAEWRTTASAPTFLESAAVFREVTVEAAPKFCIPSDRAGDVPRRQFHEVYGGCKVLHRHGLRRKAVPRALIVVVPEGNRDPGGAISEGRPRGRFARAARHERALHGLRWRELRASRRQQVLRPPVERAGAVAHADHGTPT